MDKHGIEWLKENVKRGPAIDYVFEGKSRVYLLDFLIDNTIYEVKSRYTWSREKERNQAKLDACIEKSYNVVLVLNGEEIKYDNKRLI